MNAPRFERTRLDPNAAPLEARVAADGEQQPPPEGRLRVGLYTYREAGPAAAPAPTEADTPMKRPRRARKEVSR